MHVCSCNLLPYLATVQHKARWSPQAARSAASSAFHIYMRLHLGGAHNLIFWQLTKAFLKRKTGCDEPFLRGPGVPFQRYAHDRAKNGAQKLRFAYTQISPIAWYLTKGSLALYSTGLLVRKKGHCAQPGSLTYAEKVVLYTTGTYCCCDFNKITASGFNISLLLLIGPFEATEGKKCRKQNIGG